MNEVKNTKKRILLGFMYASVLLPVFLLAETNQKRSFFTVIPPLDIVDSNHELLSRNIQLFPQKTIIQKKVRFSSIIRESNSNFPKQSFMPNLDPYHNWMYSNVYDQTQNSQIYLSTLNYYFDRVFLQFQFAHLFQNTPGTITPLPIQSVISEISTGIGFGQKTISYGKQHYPVTMLIGLKSIYNQDMQFQGEFYSNSKNHLLFFTPGMGIEGRTLSFEASLELPIAKYTPQTESQLGNHVRANIEMKYILK